MTDAEEILLQEMRDFRSEANVKLDKMSGRIDGLEMRVRSLEVWKAYLAGAWIVVAAGVAIAYEALKAWVAKHFGG